MPAEISQRQQCPSCAANGLDTAKDNLAIYADGKFCQSCGYLEKTAVKEPEEKFTSLISGVVQGLNDRGLSQKTCEKYNIRTTTYTGYLNKQQVVDEPVRVYAYYDNGKVVKQKLKSALDKKKQSQLGNTRIKGLFGQNLFSPSDKIPIVVTEGEEDSAAIWQMTGLPAVSIPNGANNAAKDLAPHLEWLSGFREVLLTFDNDDPGREAFQACVGLFEPGHAKKVTFPLKDANDMLKANRAEDVKKCLWNAEVIKPDTLVSIREVRHLAMEKPQWGMEWPWKSLTKATYGLRPGEIYLLAGPTSAGKEQPLSAKISTPSGWKTMGEIKVGDVVHGLKTTTQVTGVYPQGIKDVYKIKLSDGRECEAGLEHIWQVSSEKQIKKTRAMKKDYFSKYTTKELLEKIQHQNMYIKICNAVAYPEREYIIPPYSLGVLIGDGCLTGAGIQISSNEPDILDRVSCELGLSYSKNPCNYTHTFYTISGNRDYRKYIESVGLSVKSHEKFIPIEYLQGSVSDRKEILAGLMDTDGHISTTGSYSYSTTSNRLAQDFLELCRGLGYVAVLNEDRRDKYTTGVCYKIAVKTPHIIFKSDKHCKKYGLYKNKGNRVYIHDFVRIDDIVFDRQEESQCIMVAAEDHLYLTNDFIATHNTELIRCIISHMISQGMKVGYFSFEQLPQATIQRFVSGALNKRIYLPGTEWNDDEINTEIDKIQDSVYLYNPASGHANLESIITNIRFLNKCEGSRFFVIDNLKSLSLVPIVGGKRVAAYEYASHAMGILSMLCRQLNINIFVLNHLSEDKIQKQAYVSTSPKNPDEYLNRSAEDMNKFINKPGMEWETGRMPTIGNIWAGGNCKDLTDYIIAVGRNRMSEDPEEHRTLRVRMLKTRLDSSYEGFEFRLKYNYQSGNLDEDTDYQENKTNHLEIPDSSNLGVLK